MGKQKGMTKAQLIHELEYFDDDQEICFVFDNGDYWHHMIARPVTDIDVANVKYSGYTESFILSEEDEDDDSTKEVIILR